MTRNKKQRITIISLVLGVCMFAGAALANYTVAGGYDVYKKALLGVPYADNYTMDVTLDLLIDGKSIGTEQLHEEFSEEGDANLYQMSLTKQADGNWNSLTAYYQDQTEICIYQSDDYPEEEISVYDSERAKEYYTPKQSRYFIGGMEEENETDKKMLRFVELLADMFMGDLKNNFVYVTGDADSKQFELALDGLQVPEFVNAGLSAVFSSNYQYVKETGLQDYYASGDISVLSDPLVLLGDDPVVRSASTEFSVDSTGRLLHNDLRAELVGKDINGKSHSLVLEIAIDFSDYGTTVPKKFDLTNKEIRYMESRDSGKEVEIVETAEVTEVEITGESSSVKLELAE